MKTRKNNNAIIETLESREMFSATPAVVGYLPDYNFAKVQSAGSTTLNKINWGALTQINYFSVVPDANTGYLPSANPTLAPSQQAAGTSSSGYSLSQLTQLVAEAHAHGVKVEVVVGGAGLDGSLTTIIDTPSLAPAPIDSFAVRQVERHAMTSYGMVQLAPFPSIIGTWSGPIVVKKGAGKGPAGTQLDDFTEDRTTGEFTFNGTNSLLDGQTLQLSGSGNLSAKGVFMDSGSDIPLDSIGEFTGKGKLVGQKLVIKYHNALNSGTITLMRT